MKRGEVWVTCVIFNFVELVTSCVRLKEWGVAGWWKGNPWEFNNKDGRVAGCRWGSKILRAGSSEGKGAFGS